MSGAYHDSRLSFDPRRNVVWRALWRYYFSKRIGRDETVLDLGAGYGDFINHVVARDRIAVDQWPGMAEHLDPAVRPIIGSVTDLDAIADNSVDYAFASNLVEHLAQETFTALLQSLRTKLSPGKGRLALLQPNYRYAYREYFDDYTHVAVYSHISLSDFLEAHGWQVTEVHPRFLPLTVKSRLPTWEWLIGAYLRSPIRPMGKQMLLVARPKP